MKKNIVIYNMPEETGGELVFKSGSFLVKKSPNTTGSAFSRDNPSAPVRIDISHHIGQKGSKPRPVVMSFVTQQGKDLVLSHSKSLKIHTFFSISEQLPPSVRERGTG